MSAFVKNVLLLSTLLRYLVIIEALSYFLYIVYLH